MTCDLSSRGNRAETQLPVLPVQLSDKTYDDYLNSVLYDYGIQFSPGGSGIVEIKEALSPAQVEEEEEEEEKEEAAKTKPLNLTTERRRPTVGSQDGVRRSLVGANHESDDDPALTIDESNEAISAEVRRKKVKLYQQAPLQNPEKEKRRLNAILAKRNRDMKKRKIKSLEEQVSNLRHVNTQCNKVMRRTSCDIQRLSHELETVKAASAKLTDVLMSKDREIRQLREKLLLFQGHLDLIGTSLDDDNPARRLIFALTKRLSCQSPAAAADP